MSRKQIRSKCKLLVESILSENLVDANELLKKLLNEMEEKREYDALRLISEQDEEGGDDEGGAPEDADTDLDEADEEGGDEGDEDGEDPGLGDDLEDAQGDDGEEEDENAVGNAKLAEMGNDQVELQCEINEKMISIYTDKLSNLKTQLNAMGLDKQEREYVTFEMQISYYSKKLRELQDKCEVTVDQDEVKERLDIIEDAIKTLESQISSGDVPDVKSTEDLDEDEEGEEEGGEEEEAEGEEVEGEEEAEGEEGEEEEEGGEEEEGR